MTRLYFTEERPSRADIQRDALAQMRAGAEREQRAVDARNLELIRNDTQLRRLMTAYRQLDSDARDLVTSTAEALARGAVEQWRL